MGVVSNVRHVWMNERMTGCWNRCKPKPELKRHRGHEDGLRLPGKEREPILGEQSFCAFCPSHHSGACGYFEDLLRLLQNETRSA